MDTSELAAEKRVGGTNRLEGKIALITGGSSGIGLATAKLFVEEGAFVFITGRRQTELDSAARALGPNALAIRGDVARLADLDRMVELVQASKGRIDILFANAGVGEFAPLGAISEAHFDKAIRRQCSGDALYSSEIIAFDA